MVVPLLVARPRVARAERDSRYLTPLRACARARVRVRPGYAVPIRGARRDAILYAPPIRINLVSRRRKYTGQDIGARYYDANERPSEFSIDPRQSREIHERLPRKNALALHLSLLLAFIRSILLRYTIHSILWPHFILTVKLLNFLYNPLPYSNI